MKNKDIIEISGENKRKILESLGYLFHGIASRKTLTRKEYDAILTLGCKHVLRSKQGTSVTLSMSFAHMEALRDIARRGRRLYNRYRAPWKDLPCELIIRNQPPCASTTSRIPSTTTTPRPARHAPGLRCP